MFPPEMKDSQCFVGLSRRERMQTNRRRDGVLKNDFHSRFMKQRKNTCFLLEI